MHKLAVIFAILLSWGAAAWADAPGTLTSLAAINALDNAQAHQALHAEFEATVVFSRGYENVLFVQEGDAAIFVRPPSHMTLQQGDRVLIKGKTQNSFRPIIVAESITVLHPGGLPKPIPATFSDLIRSQFDCHLVTLRATVRSADLVSSGHIQRASLQVVTDAGHLEVDLDSNDEAGLKQLLDADVEATGVAAGKFNDKMQQTGVVIYVAHVGDIKILKKAAATPSQLAVTPMDQILANYRVRDLSPRVRVHGTITYYQRGSAVVLQDGPKSLWISTHTRENLRIGDQADATGFPDEHDRTLTLVDGEINDTDIPGYVQPQPATWEQLAFWSLNSPIGHQTDLVSIEGSVVTKVQEASQDEFVLNSNGRLFSAIYRHPGESPASSTKISIGSRVRVTGICAIVDLSSINPGHDVPFEILMRSFDDVQTIASPPLLTVRNLVILAGALVLVTLIAIARGWTLERSVHLQADAMAQLELRRSVILEGINSSRPLAEILEQVTDLVSFSLRGAPCWIEVIDAARLGRHSEVMEKARIASQEILGQTGSALGKLSVAFDPAAAILANELQALEIGARLALLAIETHRLYADLTYRSEFDALTDARNRFSLDQILNERIRIARENASQFGLIYVDLDRFKQVNDLYGHYVGDRYLQETSRRMKHQLRPGDVLARLGGDEFAVLVPVVRNRAELEEIARRLEYCFRVPISIEDHMFYGTASVGTAIYPEDGVTNDRLLNAADAAMYENKKRKDEAEEIATL